MSSAALARAVIACLTHGEGPCSLPDSAAQRHTTLVEAWQSWQELPRRPERVSALRTALDEALSRDGELRAWACAVTAPLTAPAEAAPSEPAAPPDGPHGRADPADPAT
ncbi:hypothetical protein [Peterkaempfera griseoplana]|uniref:hypothetical protein n=1 Tax=Peterkaempfera griseoplana TaxID=66896 RepID=UPI0006E159D1|nr:hypothetical protein [Peterkaempfera griseoplana]